MAVLFAAIVMGIVVKVGRYLPSSIRRRILEIYFTPIELAGNKGMLVPPKRLVRLYGPGEFEKMGKYIFEKLVNYAGLKPEHRVLDVGCGVGRIAVPLTSYLTNGYYEGFDTIPQGINWCQKHITAKFPNFQFQRVDIYNKLYNPKGKYEASQYRFPYSDNSFDVVLLYSVFTHLATEEMRHYLSEITRVLKTGGKCFITFFLINTRTEEVMKEGSSVFNFKYKLDNHCYSSHPDLAEAAIGYDELFIRGVYEKYDLKINEPIFYGGWRAGDDKPSDFQDIVIATK